LKRIYLIFENIYDVGLQKVYRILSIRYDVIKILTIMTLRLKRTLPQLKLYGFTETIRVKLDTLKYKIKKRIRRG
jgi:hypothetical protein